MEGMCPFCAKSMKCKIRGYHLCSDGHGVMQAGGLGGVISPKLLFSFLFVKIQKQD